jgi:nicotinamide mononucleotide transporter
VIQDLLDAAWSFGWVQWLAFVFNVLYVILAAREKIWCWFFGFIGVSLLLVIYLEARLYSDALLQVFYQVMAVYGWITWSANKGKETIPIIRLKAKDHVYPILAGIAGTFLLGFIFSNLQAAIPYIDAFTSAFAVVATFLVARKILENWIYWIVIDTVCIIVYISRDLPLIALLFGIYVILAVNGLLQWSRKYRQYPSAGGTL